jgi:integrase
VSKIYQHRWTVAEIVGLYVAHCRREQSHAESSRAASEGVLNAFAAEYGEAFCDEVEAFRLRDFINARAQWKASATRRWAACFVKAAFNWATIDGRISRNPFISVRYSEGAPRPAMKDSTIDVVCANTNLQYRRAFRFLRLTGRRVSEMCAADWEDIDWERRVWIVKKPKGWRRQHRPQESPLTDDAFELLKEMRHDDVATFGKATGAIFRGVRGGRLTRYALGKGLKIVKKRRGLDDPATTHGIRHRVGTEGALNPAVPIKMLSQLLGHSSIKTTERYYMYTAGETERMREAARLVAPKRD